MASREGTMRVYWDNIEKTANAVTGEYSIRYPIKIAIAKGCRSDGETPRDCYKTVHAGHATEPGLVAYILVHDIMGVISDTALCCSIAAKSLYREIRNRLERALTDRGRRDLFDTLNLQFPVACYGVTYRGKSMRNRRLLI